MSEVKLTICAERPIHGTVHGSRVDLLMAALSAEPETLEELTAACQRYDRRETTRDLFQHFQPGIDLEPWDAGLVIVDLPARLLMVDSRYSSPGPQGQVRYEDGAGERDLWLPYHLSNEWRFLHTVAEWRQLTDSRRTERVAWAQFDPRPFLYQQVAGCLVPECVAAWADKVPEPVADIHARWLLTPREALRWQSPRDILLARHEGLSWDMQDRCEQWSMVGQCPPPLGRQTQAFRCGGFGTHEIVLYYDYVRALLEECWSRLKPAQRVEVPAEIRHLEQFGQEWLHQPQGELYGMSAAQVIDLERLRIPMTVSGHQAMIDHDCPLCRMMANDEFGPIFWNLDGCNMNDGFAFDYRQRTRAEWEKEQREWDDFHRRCEQERAERQARIAAGEEAAPVWQRSFSSPASDTDAGADSPDLQLFGIGAHLSELQLDLKERPGAAELSEVLAADFAALTAAVRNRDAVLLPATGARFATDLASLSERFPDLSVKGADLRQDIERLVERSSEPIADWDEQLPF